jgi:hypothetical protein
MAQLQKNYTAAKKLLHQHYFGRRISMLTRLPAMVLFMMKLTPTEPLAVS